MFLFSFSEFSCQVSLPKMQSGSFEESSFQPENFPPVECEIISETESLADTNFQAYSESENDESETNQNSTQIPPSSSSPAIPNRIPGDAELISMYGCDVRVAGNEFRCTECSKVCTNRKSMERHVRYVHRKISKRPHCKTYEISSA